MHAWVKIMSAILISHHCWDLESVPYIRFIIPEIEYVWLIFFSLLLHVLMSTKSSMWVPHFRTHQSPPPIGLPLSDNIPYPLPPPALVLPRNSLLTCMAGWRALHEEWGDLHMTVSKLSNVYNPLPSCHWHNHATYNCNCLQGSLYLPLHRYIVPYTSFKFQLVATGM